MKKLLLVFYFSFFVLAFKQINATVYYLKTGQPITILGSWGTNPDGSGTSPVSWLGTHTWNIKNSATISLSTAWGISTTANVNIGDGSTAITFSISGSGKIGVTAGANVVITNNATFINDGGINPTAAKTTFNTGSTLETVYLLIHTII
jgi:hypothetical protein